MTTEQEALRLAENIERRISELPYCLATPIAKPIAEDTAAMLRKLVAEREADRAAMRGALEALRNGGSVCNSVSTGHDRRIRRDGCTLYAQTEEWCKWAEDEVGPEIIAAITDLRQRLEGTT